MESREAFKRKVVLSWIDDRLFAGGKVKKNHKIEDFQSGKIKNQNKFFCHFFQIFS